MRSGQSALVSSHPDIQIGNARKYIELLHPVFGGTMRLFAAQTPQFLFQLSNANLGSSGTSFSSLSATFSYIIPWYYP